VVALFAYAAGWLSDVVIKEIYYPGPQVWMMLIGVAAAHALTLLVCGYGAGTGTALFAIAVFVSLPVMRVAFSAMATNINIPSPLPNEYEPPVIGYTPVWAALGSLAFWFVAAFIGARQARREVPEDPVGKLVRLAQHMTYLEREHAVFKSPEAAQRWFEWRRGAYLFPWMSLGLGLTLLLTFNVVLEQLEMRFVVSFNLLVVAPAIVASLVGYVMTRSTNEYNWFVGARPLSTAMIARTRLQAGAKAVAWAYLLLAIAFVIANKLKFPSEPILASLVHDLRVMTSTQGPFSQGAALLAFMAVGAVLASWTLFWIARAAGVFVWIAGMLVAGWYYTAGSLYVYQEAGASSQFVTPMTVFIWGMSVLLGAAAVTTLAAGVIRGFVRGGTLAGLVLCWVGLAASAWLLFRLLDFGSPALVVVWLLLPLVPLASVPLTLEWQRHR
jgi:hypothetical protein